MGYKPRGDGHIPLGPSDELCSSILYTSWRQWRESWLIPECSTKIKSGIDKKRAIIDLNDCIDHPEQAETSLNLVTETGIT